MTNEEMVELIRPCVKTQGGVWADFGAGRGNFTRALVELLGAEAEVYAVDRDAHALRAHRSAKTIQADFRHPLELPPLDGLFMSNALHFAQNQDVVLTRIKDYLKEGGQLIIVEYEVHFSRSHIPYPVPFRKFEQLASQVGFHGIEKLKERDSQSTGVAMYSAVAYK